uniref:Uncharacterized protein n=1 Tax=Tetranychus urticae TaxID=32264 RepID=A0A158P5I2_TETUR
MFRLTCCSSLTVSSGKITEVECNPVDEMVDRVIRAGFKSWLPCFLRKVTI